MHIFDFVAVLNHIGCAVDCGGEMVTGLVPSTSAASISTTKKTVCQSYILSIFVSNCKRICTEINS